MVRGNNRKRWSKEDWDEYEREVGERYWAYMVENYRNPRFCNKHGIDPSAVRRELLDMVLESNRADVRARNNRYYQKNADRIREKIQKHREEHHEEILADKRIYAQKRYTCECGCEVARNNLARHLKTDKHKQFENSKPSSS